MSPQISGKPASRASCRASAALAAVWVRPRRRSWVSSALCTPKLIRVMPAARNPCRVSRVTVSGLASSVISAPGRGPPLPPGRQPEQGRAGPGCRRRNRECRAVGCFCPVPAAGRPRSFVGLREPPVQSKNHSTGTWPCNRERADKYQKNPFLTFDPFYRILLTGTS